MHEAQVIYTELTECQDCYKCLRECPVKAIQIVQGHARVIEERCIHCGTCVEVCPQKAKKVRKDLDRARILVRLRPKSVLSLAPSFVAEFPELPVERLIAACRRLGFTHVSETSVGADLVSRGMRELVERERPAMVISSACPSVVQYIDKYLPSMRTALSESCSPMVAHARMLRQMLGQDTAVVFAGPCIAKKWEADHSGGAVDVALTFQELRAWLEEAGIDPARQTTSDRDGWFPGRAQDGVLYPIEGGMIASVKHQGSFSAHCMTCSGILQIRSALEGLEDAEIAVSEAGERTQKEPLFLELLACEGGCINGPLASSHTGTVRKRLRVLENRKARREQVHVPESWAQRWNMPESLGDLLAMPEELREEALAEPGVSEEALRSALASIGKYTRKDELNCAGCGYDSCRAFAAAMMQGKAEKTMCLSYMRKLAQKKANALLRTMPSAAVVVDASLHIVECNRHFAELLGDDALEMFDIKPSLEGADLRKFLPFWQAFEQVLMPDGQDIISSDFQCKGKILHGSIFSIEKGLLVGGLFQDITAPWIQKDRVIAQAKKVMHQNLKTVQKIAYLLGENAAEAEAALTSIIESFQAEKPAREFGKEREAR